MARGSPSTSLDTFGTLDGNMPIRPQIYARLRDALIRTVIRPGEAISEKELCVHFGISRTPIREALIRLSEEGLVEVRPQIGTFATKLKLSEIREAMFVREALECAAVRHACVNATAQDCERLAEIIALQAKALEQAVFDRVYEIDAELHRTLIGLSGYPGAWHLVRTTRAHLARLRFLAVPILKTVDRALADHRGIVEVVTRRDADLAAQRMRDHLTVNLSYAERLVEDCPDLFDPAEQRGRADCQPAVGFGAGAGKREIR